MRQMVICLSILILSVGCANFPRNQPLEIVGMPSLINPVRDGDVVRARISFSGGHWNPDMVLDRTEGRVRGTEIDITTTTSVFRHAGSYPAPSPFITLGNISGGQYDVYYRDPDGIRHYVQQLTIPPPEHELDTH